MKKSKVLLAISTCILLAGCAGSPPTSSAASGFQPPKEVSQQLKFPLSMILTVQPAEVASRTVFLTDIKVVDSDGAVVLRGRAGGLTSIQPPDAVKNSNTYCDLNLNDFAVVADRNGAGHGTLRAKPTYTGMAAQIWLTPGKDGTMVVHANVDYSHLLAVKTTAMVGAIPIEQPMIFEMTASITQPLSTQGGTIILRDHVPPDEQTSLPPQDRPPCPSLL